MRLTTLTTLMSFVLNDFKVLKVVRVRSAACTIRRISTPPNHTSLRPSLTSASHSPLAVFAVRPVSATRFAPPLSAPRKEIF